MLASRPDWLRASAQQRTTSAPVSVLAAAQRVHSHPQRAAEADEIGGVPTCL
jgi:hypothetical protein